MYMYSYLYLYLYTEIEHSSSLNAAAGAVPHKKPFLLVQVGKRSHTASCASRCRWPFPSSLKHTYLIFVNSFSIYKICGQICLHTKHTFFLTKIYHFSRKGTFVLLKCTICPKSWIIIAINLKFLHLTEFFSGTFSTTWATNISYPNTFPHPPTQTSTPSTPSSCLPGPGFSFFYPAPNSIWNTHRCHSASCWPLVVAGLSRS